MRTLSDLLVVAGTMLSPGSAGAHPAKEPAAQEASFQEPDETLPAKTTFADLGGRIGEDNEVLRNLLIDTSHQLGALDELKDTFGKLVGPLGNLLQTLERERADHASSRGALSALRTSHETLRSEHQTLDKKSAELQVANDRLTRDLASSLQTSRELGEEKVRITSELAVVRTASEMLVKQLGEETSNVRLLREERGLLTRRAENAVRQVATLEAELAHAREQLALLGNDKSSLQAALDKTLAESSKTSRRLAASESAVADARARIQQVEASLASAEAERNRLAGACDEANERRQSDVYALELKLDAMTSRSEAAEKLLAEARQNLAARTEDVRTAETRLEVSTAAHGEAEKKALQLASGCEERDGRIKALEQQLASFTERTTSLAASLASSEGALAEANGRITALAAQLEQVQADAAAQRTRTEEDFVQLNATVEHERAERGLAEGALETLRADYARLQRQMSEERSIRRRDHQRRVVRPMRTP